MSGAGSTDGSKQRAKTKPKAAIFSQWCVVAASPIAESHLFAFMVSSDSSSQLL